MNELDEILCRLSDGTLSEQDAARLNELLLGDPEACELYLNHITLEAQLERELSGAVGEGNDLALMGHRPPIEGRAGIAEFPKRFRFALPVLAAAAVLAVSIVLWPMVFPPSAPAPVASVTSVGSGQYGIATLLFAEDCEWSASGGRLVSEGDRLGGESLHLLRGTAVVRFDGGAEMVLSEGTELELLSAARASLARGEVVVRAEGEAAGFVLETPTGELTDFGTEFAVTVRRDGSTDLQVHEGEVGYAQARGGKAGAVKAGETLRFELSKDPVGIIGAAPRFAQRIRQANPRTRPDLMTVYEGFFYDEGSYQPEQITRGKGWAGPWRLRLPAEQLGARETDSTTDMRIVHGMLNVAWPVEGGRLGMLEMPAGRSFRIRQMRRPIAMEGDGITYFSLMTHEPDHAAGIAEATRPAEGMRLTFRGSDDYSGESLSFGWNGELRPQIQAGSAGIFASPAMVPDEQSLLWIGKILRRAQGEDEVSFRIYGQDDRLEYAEPAIWHVVSRGLHHDAALDLVVLSSTGKSPRIADELRIGPTWRSVVPIQTLLTEAK